MAHVQPKPTKQSELSEWLIDSGCSSHMASFKDDLIADIPKSESLVEVASRNMILKAPKKGKILIGIVDLISNEKFDILLEDVFYAPVQILEVSYHFMVTSVKLLTWTNATITQIQSSHGRVFF